MRCPACSSDNPERARFCASCGAALAAEAPAALVCPACERRTQAVTYFSRGANVAKMAILAIPFNVVGPLVFFFLRKDRFVCVHCRSLLPVEAPVGLLEAFSARTTVDPALVPAEARDEAPLLERKSHKQRRRAWGFGVMTAGLGSVAVAASGEPGAFFGVLAGLSGVGAAASALRGRTLARRADEVRRRRRRLEILDLARAHGGRLTVTLVAARLRLDLEEAERALDGLVDGRRVDVQVDDEGNITYVFPEIVRALPAPE